MIVDGRGVPADRYDQGGVRGQPGRTHGPHGDDAPFSRGKPSSGEDGCGLAAGHVPPEHGAGLGQIPGRLEFRFRRDGEQRSVFVDQGGPHVRGVVDRVQQGGEIIRVEGGHDQAGEGAAPAGKRPLQVDRVGAQVVPDGRRDLQHGRIVAPAGQLEIGPPLHVLAEQRGPVAGDDPATGVEHGHGPDPGHGTAHGAQAQVQEVPAGLPPPGMGEIILERGQRVVDGVQLPAQVVVDHLRQVGQPLALPDADLLVVRLEVPAHEAAQEQQPEGEHGPFRRLPFHSDTHGCPLSEESGRSVPGLAAWSATGGRRSP